jgi:hypothetical protein
MTTHRADLIVDAAAAVIRARVEPMGAHVYTHRRLSLGPESDELPAISVDFGADDPVDQVSPSHLDSVLTLEVAIVVAEADEESLKRNLLQWRREVHVALMADRKLGQPSFVVGTAIAETDAPEYDTSGELLVGSVLTRWPVMYRSPHEDPGI